MERIIIVCFHKEAYAYTGPFLLFCLFSCPPGSDRQHTAPRQSRAKAHHLHFGQLRPWYSFCSPSTWMAPEREHPTNLIVLLVSNAKEITPEITLPTDSLSSMCKCKIMWAFCFLSSHFINGSIVGMVHSRLPVCLSVSEALYFSDSEATRAKTLNALDASHPNITKHTSLQCLCLLTWCLMCWGLSIWRPPWAWTFHLLSNTLVPTWSKQAHTLLVLGNLLTYSSLTAPPPFPGWVPGPHIPSAMSHLLNWLTNPSSPENTGSLVVCRGSHLRIGL